MATIGTGGRFHRTAAFTLALLFTLAIAAPALAKSGNSAAAAACQDGGYVDWTDAAGNAFRNTGACVSYAAHGGTLVPVVVDPVNPFSVSYRPSGTSGFQATVTGSGLEPNSSVDLFLTWGGTTAVHRGRRRRERRGRVHGQRRLHQPRVPTDGGRRRRHARRRGADGVPGPAARRLDLPAPDLSRLGVSWRCRRPRRRRGRIGPKRAVVRPSVRS